MPGPYDTEPQARADAPRVPRSRVRPGAHIRPNRARLHDVAAYAGVQLGAYDERIIDWIAGWESTTVQVIADLIRRAHVAGQQLHAQGIGHTIGAGIGGGSSERKAAPVVGSRRPTPRNTGTTIPLT